MPRLRRLSLSLMLPMLITLLPVGDVVRAQQGSGVVTGDPTAPLVKRTDLYCAGFISDRKVTPEFYIIGGEKESEQDWYTTTNVVYLNYGAKHGASVGESLYVIREKGKYENPYTGKDLGRYFEELGVIRILSVQRDISIASVEESCYAMRMGDLVRPYDGYVSPEPREFKPLNRYDLPSGKLSGQIVLARDNHEMLTQRDVVYLDIGDKAGVKLGQYFTIYRDAGEHEGPVGTQFNPFTEDDDDFPHRVDGYRDDRYRGSDLAIIKGKKRQDVVREDRVGVPRKVVGEVCIIRVEGKSATALITRTTQEAFIGDYVELQ